MPGCSKFLILRRCNTEFISGKLKRNIKQNFIYNFFCQSFEIIKYLLTTFKNVLKELEEKYENTFKVVDTQGTITDENQWLNEIHPTSEGFKLISEKIYGEGIVPLIN